MISCFQLKPCVKCFSNLFKKVLKLKKLVVEPKMAQPVEPFLAQKTSIFNLKYFKQVGKTFETRF